MSYLLTRRTPLKLSPPGPPPEVIETALQAAEAAPDHGRLRPWQFVVVVGEGLAKLGEIMAAALAQREPETSLDLLQKEREKPMRTPLIIVVATAYVDSPKIPAIEQLMAATCAAQNLQLAFHEAGYGVQWKTGAAARDPAIKTALGIASHDELVGFMYVGTIAEAKPPRPLTEPKVRRWA